MYGGKLMFYKSVNSQKKSNPSKGVIKKYEKLVGIVYYDSGWISNNHKYVP